MLNILQVISINEFSCSTPVKYHKNRSAFDLSEMKKKKNGSTYARERTVGGYQEGDEGLSVDLTVVFVLVVRTVFLIACTMLSRIGEDVLGFRTINILRVCASP